MTVARSRSSRGWYCWALVAIAPSCATEAAVSTRVAWEYRAPDLQPNTLLPPSCASPGGRLLVLASARGRYPSADVALLLSPTGEVERRSFPTLDGGGERLVEAMTCHWIDEDRIVVIARTSTEAVIAAWLLSDLALDMFLDIGAGPKSSLVPSRVVAISNDEFVLVGMRDDEKPAAVRFNRQQAAMVTLPGAGESRGELKDVIARNGGGFTVCGVETSRGVGQPREVGVVVAAFDAAGTVEAKVRLEGRVCRLLSDREGMLRLLHDDGAVDRLGLLLTTLGESLEVLGEEVLARPAAPHPALPAAVMGHRIFFVNNFYGFEQLEIRGPGETETLDLEVSAGQFADLQPGPSLIYLVSATAVPPRAEGLDFGLRVEAHVIDDK